MRPKALVENEFGRLWIPADDQSVVRDYQLRGGWEKELVHFICARCFPNGVGTFIDVGAHVGLISIPVAVRYPGVSISAFEAHPENFELLLENVRLHDLRPTRFTTFNLAVGVSDGNATLLVTKNDTVDHRLVTGREGTIGRWGEEARERITVPMMTLAHLEAAPRPIVLKIDVQGSELGVLRGLGDLKPDIVIMEVWPYGLARAGGTVEEAERLLAPYAFGSILIDRHTQLQEGLHLKLLRVLPWSDEASPSYFDLICARRKENCP